MSYIDQNLTAGETVLYRTRLHWIAMFWYAVFAALLGITGLSVIVAALGDFKNSGGMAVYGLFFIAVAAGLVWLGNLMRSSVEMGAVTNKRVIIKVGLISKRTVELFLTKVESVGVNQGILGRILGYGSVIVRGTGGTAEPFRHVAHPEEFRHQVQHHMESAHGVAAGQN